jgi:hypothetical protein
VRTATGVLRIALPDLEVPEPAEPWPPTPAVILARAVNAALEDTEDADAPWDRVQRKLNEEHKLLADAMARHGPFGRLDGARWDHGGGRRLSGPQP